MTYKFNRRFSNDSCHKPTKHQPSSIRHWPTAWVVWSSRSSISLISNRAPRGSKWGPWCSKFPIFRPSPHRNGVPFCRTKSILFTKVWGALECPFLCRFRPFQALWLSSEQTLTYLGGNSYFPRSKLRLFSEPFSHLYSYHTICKQILSKAWHRDNRDSSFKAIPITQNTPIIYIICILYI